MFGRGQHRLHRYYGHYSVQIERQVNGQRCPVDLTLYLQAATVQIYPNKDLSIEHADDVQRIVRFYALRWRIERLHFTLKSGALNVEKRQFDDVHTLVNALTFYSVVAWQLWALTYALRHDPQQPAETMFDPDELTLLHHLSGQPVDSLSQATLALAKLVGFARLRSNRGQGLKF